MALIGTLGLVALLAVLGVQAMLAGGGGPQTAADGPGTETSAPADGTSPPAQEQTRQAQTPADPGAQVPDGWERYPAEGRPYSFAHPADWQVQPREGNRTDFQDPTTGAYVRIGWTNDPNADPLQDRQEYSQRFAESHEGYREVTLERTTFRGHEAALWEYTYREGGAQLHAIQVSWVADGTGYAINYQTHAEDWEQLRDLWPQIQAAFEMAG